MKTLTAAGRILFGLLYIYSAAHHFLNANELAPGVPSYIPGGIIWVYVTGIIMLAGGVFIIINRFIRTGAIMIGILMLVFVFLIHFPGIFDPERKLFATGFFFNNLALAGAAFFMAGSANYEGRIK